MARGSYVVSNVSERIISIGDLRKAPTIEPGGSCNLTNYYTIQEIGQSIDLASMISHGWLREKVYDPDEKTVTETETEYTTFSDQSVALPNVAVTETLDAQGFGAMSQRFGYQVSMYGIPEVWKDTQGEGVVIGILDTGAQTNHEDLSGQFASSQPNVSDGHGHGSHVAGIISATNNSLGIVGIAPKAKLIAIPVLDHRGRGSEQSIVAGIRKAIDLGCDIINMSLGASVDLPEIHRFLFEAYEKNIVVVCASGNSGDVGKTLYPGRYPETISVGALDKNNIRAWFSQTGPRLDFMAPGVSVLSTYPGNRYAYMSGTCLPKEVSVYTNTGPISIGEIKSGDIVYSHTDSGVVESKVKKQWSNGFKELRKIKTTRTSLRCTDNHPILTINRNGRGKSQDLEWRRADQIFKGDFIVSADGIPCPVRLKEISIKDHWSVSLRKSINVSRSDVREKNIDLSVNLDTAVAFLNAKHGMRYDKAKILLESFDINRSNLLFGTCSSSKIPLSLNIDESIAYLVGFYLGDGWICQDNRNKKGISGSYKSLYFAKCNIEKINSHLRHVFASTFLHELIELDNSQFICRNSMIADIFFDLCNGSHRARDKFIPSWVFYQDRSVVDAFISGIVDSDGCVKRKGYGVSSCSKKLIEGLCALCDYVGIRRNNMGYRRRKVQPPNSKKPIFTEEYSLTMSIDPSRVMGVKCASKFIEQETYPTLGGGVATVVGTGVRVERVVEVVEKDGTEEVFDIEVEGNHNFVANNMVVHNSMACPWVSGVVALIISKHRKLGGRTPVNSVEDVREHLRKTAIDLDNIGHDDRTGYGLIDVSKAISELDKLKGPDLIVSAIRGDAPGHDAKNLLEEWIEFTNISGLDVDLSGWAMDDLAGWHYDFAEGFVVKSGCSFKIRTGIGEDSDTDLYFNYRRPIWNNPGDTVKLHDKNGKEQLNYSYGDKVS